MKRFLIKISIFFTCFLACNYIYLAIAKNVDWNFKKSIEARSLIDQEIDVIVLGNSLAMDGINTEIIGKAYNLSIGGASLETSLHQLEYHISSSNQVPRTAILGLGSSIAPKLKKEGLHPILRYLEDPYLNSFYELPLLRFKWMGLVMLKRLISKDHRSAQLVQGQLRLGSVKADRSDYPPSLLDQLDRKKYEDLLQLSAIASVCHDNKIRLIVVEMPGIKARQDAIPIGPHFFDKFELYNLNNKDFCTIFDSDTHWLGGSHLNTEGAEVLTHEMLSLVKL